MATRLLVLGGSGFVGDRHDPTTLTPLLQGDWDVVADTWSGAPRAVRDSTAALAERVGRYVYISSGSVYGSPLPIGLDEDAPTLTAHPDDGDGDYAANKRGLELAVLAAFGDRALVARAGSIGGPGDDIGRLLSWLIWLDPAQIARAEIEEWSELPVWLPPGHEMEGLLGMDTERAHSAGLRCRPIAETVADTWRWMASLSGPPSLRSDPPPGLPPAKGRAALARL
jgi:hypothetical protein